MNRLAYNRIAAVWDGARQSFCGREQVYLDTLLADLSPPAAVLDLGCGSGRPLAQYVLGRGHRLTGVDQAAAMLAYARQRLPQGEWIEARIEDYRTQARYAAILCWDVLFHIERCRHASLLERMAGWLQPGGRLMLTVGGSEHPAFTDTMFGERFFYDSHPPQRVLELLDASGFEPLLAEFMNRPTSGRDKGRFAIVARRRAAMAAVSTE